MLFTHPMCLLFTSVSSNGHKPRQRWPLISKPSIASNYSTVLYIKPSLILSKLISVSSAEVVVLQNSLPSFLPPRFHNTLKARDGVIEPTQSSNEIIESYGASSDPLSSISALRNVFESSHYSTVRPS